MILKSVFEFVYLDPGDASLANDPHHDFAGVERCNLGRDLSLSVRATQLQGVEYGRDDTVQFQWK
jgi:hypothetical protein